MRLMRRMLAGVAGFLLLCNISVGAMAQSTPTALSITTAPLSGEVLTRNGIKVEVLKIEPGTIVYRWWEARLPQIYRSTDPKKRKRMWEKFFEQAQGLNPGKDLSRLPLGDTIYLPASTLDIESAAIITELKEELKNMRLTLAQANARIKELDGGIASAKAHGEQQAGEIARLTAERDRLAGERDALSNEMANASGELKRLRLQLQETNDKLAATNTVIERLNGQIAGGKGNIGSLTAERDRLVQARDELGQQLAQANAKLTTLHTDLDKALAELAETKEKMREQNARIQQLEVQLAVAKANGGTQAGQITALTAERDAAIRERDHYREKLIAKRFQFTWLARSSGFIVILLSIIIFAMRRREG